MWQRRDLTRRASNSSKPPPSILRTADATRRSAVTATATKTPKIDTKYVLLGGVLLVCALLFASRSTFPQTSDTYGLVMSAATTAGTHSQMARQEILRQLLSRVCSLLRGQEIPHWLMYETLRSWHTERRISGHAYDVHLGSLVSHKSRMMDVLRVGLESAQEYELVDDESMGVRVYHVRTGLALEMTLYDVVTAAGTNDGMNTTGQDALLVPCTPSERLRSFLCHMRADIPCGWVLPVFGDRLNGVEVPVPSEYIRVLDIWYGDGRQSQRGTATGGARGLEQTRMQMDRLGVRG